PKGKGYMDTEKINHLRISTQPKDSIIEFRGDGSQTVMPGTIHESTGELISWENGKPTSLPAAVDSLELRKAVRKIAFTVMLADHGWTDGSRHDISLCLGGMFHAAKWSLEEAEQFMHVFMNYVGESAKDRKNRINAIRDTYKSAGRKERIQGGPKMMEITGCPQLVSEFRKLFMDIRETVFEDMNARYACGVYFSKVCMFDFDVIDDVTVSDFETLSVNDFHILMSNKRVKVPGQKGDRWVPVSKFWLEHPNRRTYRITDFMPGKPEEVDGKLNLWRGWAVKPKSSGSVQAWRDHVHRYICGENDELEQWLMMWLADIVQNPMSKPGTAVMMRSGQRSGKNTFIEMMKRVIGIRYCREMNLSGQITNQFNSHFQYALLVFANEANFASSHTATNVLKTLITDPDFHMDHKHGHAKTGRNFARVVLASNRLHVIDRDRDDQRYTVIDVVNPAHTMEMEEKQRYFTKIYDEIDGDGPAKLLDFLTNYEVDSNLIRNCYQSEAGRLQTLMSMNPVAQWWARCVSDGRIRVPDTHFDRVSYENGEIGWPKHIGKSALESAFREQHRGHEKIASPAFHAMLYEVSGLDSRDTRQVGSRNTRYRALLLPKHEDSVKKLNKVFPGAIDESAPITDEDFAADLERTDEMEEF
ncbi:MAG: primase-helicase family protein, partial [Geminicoccaceae bacterium]